MMFPTATIIDLVAEAGYKVSIADVEEFAKYGSIPESVVGTEYDKAVEEALTEAFDKLGLTPGGGVS